MERAEMTLLPENGNAISVPVQQKEALKNAASLAQDVAKIVKDNGLAKRFGSSPKEHVFVEGWLTISRVNNEAPHAKVEAVETHGDFEVIKARAWITDAAGNVVSEADGYCSTEEGNWKGKPFYARASMAQTRAIGKAMRLRHAWVMVMAGFSPTPAEEMDGVLEEPKPKQQEPAKAPKVYKLKPQQPTEGDDAEKVPASVTDAAAPTAEPLVVPDGNSSLLEATILATSKARNEKSNTYGILVNKDGHKQGCNKDDSQRVKCDCGGDYWINTFHDTPWNEAKTLKGKRVVFAMVTNGKGFTNVESIEGVQ